MSILIKLDWGDLRILINRNVFSRLIFFSATHLATLGYHRFARSKYFGALCCSKNYWFYQYWLCLQAPVSHSCWFLMPSGRPTCWLWGLSGAFPLAILESSRAEPPSPSWFETNWWMKYVISQLQPAWPSHFSADWSCFFFWLCLENGFLGLPSPNLNRKLKK